MKRISYIITDKVISSKHESGYAIHINAVINRLRDMGYDVQTYIEGDRSLRNNTKLHQVEMKQSLLHKLIPVKIKNLLREILFRKSKQQQKNRIEEFIRETKPEVIYERQTYGNTIVADLCQKYNIPLILETNAPQAEEQKVFNRDSLLNFIGKREEKHSLEIADSVIVVSSELKKYLSQSYHIIDDKIQVIPNAVDANWLKKMAAKNDSPVTPKVIGFVGSFLKWHKVDSLIRAFSIFAKSSALDVELLLVGDGEQKQTLMTLVNELNISDQVTFTGMIHHENIADYINNMDICVMAASNWYGSPIKIFEYGAFGKPIIAPRTGPVLEVMEDRVDGYIVDGEKELEAAIREIFIDYDKAIAIAKHFQTKVINEYTWTKVADKTAEIIEKNIKVA